MAISEAAHIREGLKHPILDGDGHWLEPMPIWLEFLRTGDPALRSLLMAPLDDEPTTDKENAGAEEAWAEYQRDEFITADEAKARLLS